MSTPLSERIPQHVIILFERALSGDVSKDELTELPMREINLMLALTALWLIDVIDRVEVTLDTKPADEQRRIMAGIEEASALIDECMDVFASDLAAT
jgi:hypothetical protein